MKLGWTVAHPDRVSAINCLSHMDITHSGINDIVVGRDDGMLEVYSFDTEAEPQQVFVHELNESVTAIDHGYLSSLNTQDICISTYSGKILGFSAESTATAPESSSGGLFSSFLSGGNKKQGKEELEKVVSSMKLELDKLKEKVGKEKEKYSK